MACGAANVVPDLCRHMKSLDHKEFKHLSKSYPRSAT